MIDKFTRTAIIPNVKANRVTHSDYLNNLNFCLEYADDIKSGRIVAILVNLPNASEFSIRASTVMFPEDIETFNEFTKVIDGNVKMILRIPEPMDTIPELVVEYWPIDPEVIQSEIEKRERQIAFPQSEITELKAKLK